MSQLGENLEWRTRWEERGEAVRSVLGETLPPGIVTSFSWTEYVLPGACALTFAPTDHRKDYLYMTLGLTQPLRTSDPVFPWEFAVRSEEHLKWPVDLLYQLATQWLCENGNMGWGCSIPLVFFKDPTGNLWAGLTDNISTLNVVGSIRRLYLWLDELGLEFRVSTGKFGLLTAVAVTEAEERLARDTTPAHLVLLLRRTGVSQICNPYRHCVTTKEGMSNEWTVVRRLSHDNALRELQMPATRQEAS